jgi:hypothetical protein
MIVKMVILRLLGSSDDKKREDRRSKAQKAVPTGVRIKSTGRTDA